MVQLLLIHPLDETKIRMINTQTIKIPGGRKFQLWIYTVSHSQLLLRSTKDNKNDTRVDILFKPVSFIQIPHTVHGLSIREIDIQSARDLALKMPHQPSEKIFELTTPEGHFYIVAGSCTVHEDTGEYFEKSHFEIQLNLIGATKSG